MALGIFGFIRIAVASQFYDTYGPAWALVGMTLWVALIGVVVWGTVVGAMLPLALKRLGVDPATSSTPFVATLVDVTGIFIYFQVAALILRGTLL
jgi:magnesium transporter